MGLRTLNEVLNSGEVSNMRIANNIQFDKANVPEAENMFMRIGFDGRIVLYRAPDQDLHWEDTDNTKIGLDTVLVEILSVTVTETVTSDDGSYTLSCRLDNTANQNRSVNIVVFVDGLEIGRETYDLDKNEIDKVVLLSSGINTTIIADSVVSVEIEADGPGVELMGNLLESKFTITKAIVAVAAQTGGVIPSTLIAKGTTPAVKLEVESGGIAGAFQIYDMEAPAHLVAGAEWIKNNQELIIFVSDKDTGVIKSMLQLKPDGKAYIGNGMIQHQVATEVEVDALHNDIMTVAKVAVQKANKTSLPTIFSGDTIPLDTLGKDLDWYHHVEAGSNIVKDLYVSACRENYHHQYTTLAAVYQGDAEQNEIAIVELAPHANILYIDLSTSNTLHIEELTLEITNHGEATAVIPITVTSNGAGSFTGTYSNSFDTVIQGILGVDNNNLNPSTFKITVKEGVQTDKEYDYQKHNGVWKRTDFLNVEEVNTLIREYGTIVVQDLADPKKPTRAESITAFKTLPHYSWAKNDAFCIRDSGGGNKIVSMQYLADGATDEASAGPFFKRDMDECV